MGAGGISTPTGGSQGHAIFYADAKCKTKSTDSSESPAKIHGTLLKVEEFILKSYDLFIDKNVSVNSIMHNPTMFSDFLKYLELEELKYHSIVSAQVQSSALDRDTMIPLVTENKEFLNIVLDSFPRYLKSKTFRSWRKLEVQRAIAARDQVDMYGATLPDIQSESLESCRRQLACAEVNFLNINDQAYVLNISPLYPVASKEHHCDAQKGKIDYENILAGSAISADFIGKGLDIMEAKSVSVEGLEQSFISRRKTNVMSSDHISGISSGGLLDNNHQNLYLVHSSDDDKEGDPVDGGGMEGFCIGGSAEGRMQMSNGLRNHDDDEEEEKADDFQAYDLVREGVFRHSLFTAGCRETSAHGACIPIGVAPTRSIGEQIRVTNTTLSVSPLPRHASDSANDVEETDREKYHTRSGNISGCRCAETNLSQGVDHTDDDCPLVVARQVSQDSSEFMRKFDAVESSIRSVDIVSVRELLTTDCWLTVFIAAVENLPISVTISTASKDRYGFPLIYVNKQFEKLTGYPRSEAVGQNCNFLQKNIHGIHRAEKSSVSVMQRSLHAPMAVVTTIINYRKDGGYFRNLIGLKPLLDVKGHYRYVIGVQYEITESLEFDREKEALFIQLHRGKMRQLLSAIPDGISVCKAPPAARAQQIT